MTRINKEAQKAKKEAARAIQYPRASKPALEPEPTPPKTKPKAKRKMAKKAAKKKKTK